MTCVLDNELEPIFTNESQRLLYIIDAAYIHVFCRHTSGKALSR
jgi:hypothetical protein